VYNSAKMKKPATASEAAKRKKQEFPPGLDEKRVQDVVTYYDRQTEDEALAEYDAGMKIEGLTVILVPSDLVPEVRRLIRRRRGA
jgi:hypothetical protein